MIALLPLDNRPCNLQFPAQIAAIGGAQLLAPPVNRLGQFNQRADCDALRAWLDDLPEVSALIVSIDMLAYGGLVASRKPPPIWKRHWRACRRFNNGAARARKRRFTRSTS